MNTYQNANAVNFIHSLTVQSNIIHLDLLQLGHDLKAGLISQDEYEKEKALLQAEIVTLR